MTSAKYCVGDIMEFRNTLYGDFNRQECIILRVHEEPGTNIVDYGVRFIAPHLRDNTSILAHEHELRFLA